MKISGASALLITALLAFAHPVFAYDISSDDLAHNRKDAIETTVGKDKTSYKVTLLKEYKRDFADFNVVKDAKLRIEGGGRVFTAEIQEPICLNSSGLESVILGGEEGSFIAVSSAVPHHEDHWQMILYGFDGKALTELLKVTSNEPTIEIKDADNDGTKDIVVVDRDYENNPSTDKYITSYKYINDKWQRATIYRTKTKELKSLTP